MKHKLDKKDLEETIKEKVNPLLEETMEKHWGITIPKLESDITDKLRNPSLNVYVPLNLTFSQAKKLFKSEFLKRELRLHRGNISQLAKTLGINRRSIHRAIKELSLGFHREEGGMSKDDYQIGVIDQAIRSTLDQYKQILHPQQMEKMYQQVSTLSRNIARFLPLEDLTWKEAEREFERQFLSQVLKEHSGKVSETAKKMKLRQETLYRKIKKLGLGQP